MGQGNIMEVLANVKTSNTEDGFVTAEITRIGALDMQVCVPAEWADAAVKAFADGRNLCGTSGGWFIRKHGDPALDGAAERVPCEIRSGHVHIMLDA